MEPVFMIMGQSAATAASLAIEAGVAVQKVDYARLRERLVADGQILEWTGPARGAGTNLDPTKLPGLVLDDKQAEAKGDWSHAATMRCLGDGYLHDGNLAKGERAAVFRPEIREAGAYEIFLLYPPQANRATNVPVSIAPEGGETLTVKVNQKKAGAMNETSLGVFALRSGKSVTVTISNAGTDGHVIVDGVQLLKK